MRTIAIVVLGLASAAQGQVFSILPEAPPAVSVPGAVPGPRPTRGAIVAIDQTALGGVLGVAPLQRFDAPLHTYGVHMAIPSPEGVMVDCVLAESPVMEAPLAERFPQIRTYIVQSADRTATGRLEWSPRGVTAMLRSVDGSVWMIDPWQSADPRHAVSYRLTDLPGGNDWACHTVEGQHGFSTPEAPAGFSTQTLRTLRTLRLAMACTGEYGVHQSTIQGHPPNAADPLATIVTIVGRSNVVFEADMAVHFNLVANNDQVVFFDPTTDPYADTCDGASGTDCSGGYLSTNISTLSTRIGNANFDIGHIVTRVFGGVAYLSCVCTNNKAGGVSGIPRGGDVDPFTALVVIHEMGHQFGAAHTFSGTRGRCGGNVSTSSAWEAGSGSSPMAYAGGCPVGSAPPSDNVAIFADPFFHHGSFNQMTTFLNGASCPVQTTSENSIPVIESSTGDRAIPPGTPFVLSASASDADGDPLTYSWEQFDAGVARPLSGTGSADNGSGSLFRIFPPVPVSQRTFPRMADVLSGTPTPGERLPTATGANRRFRVMVRDNHAGVGGVAISSFVNLTIAQGASPFTVVSPVADAVLRGGPNTVAWTVGGTNAAPILCATVTVRLSTDDGATFPLVLGSFPNTGTAVVALPDVDAAARIRIDGDGAIFFAVSRPFVLRARCVADVVSVGGLAPPDGSLTGDDFNAFIGAFSAGEALADIASIGGQPPSDGMVTGDDFVAFINSFASGCP